MAVFLMDNVSSHITSDGIGLVTEGWVRVITFVSDAIQIFQLDWRELLSCPQTASKIWTAFRRQENDREMSNERIWRLQTDTLVPQRSAADTVLTSFESFPAAIPSIPQ
jgi:hypothetical protein